MNIGGRPVWWLEGRIANIEAAEREEIHAYMQQYSLINEVASQPCGDVASAVHSKLTPHTSCQSSDIDYILNHTGFAGMASIMH